MSKHVLFYVYIAAYTAVHLYWWAGAHGLTVSLSYLAVAVLSAITYHDLPKVWKMARACGCEDDVILFGMVSIAISSIMYVPATGMPIIVILLLYTALYTSPFLRNVGVVKTMPAVLLFK
jgi:hypothetical protein